MLNFLLAILLLYIGWVVNVPLLWLICVIVWAVASHYQSRK